MLGSPEVSRASAMQLYAYMLCSIESIESLPSDCHSNSNVVESTCSISL